MNYVTCKHDGISHTGMVYIEMRPRTSEGQCLNGSDNHSKEIGRGGTTTKLLVATIASIDRRQNASPRNKPSHASSKTVF